MRHLRNLELLLLLIVEKYITGDVNPQHRALLSQVAREIVSEHTDQPPHIS